MAQRLHFSDVTVVYICPAHNEKYLARKAHMDELCKELGFKEVVHWKSGTEAYPECLSIATIEIFERFADRPILLLEDDVDAQGLREFDVPCDADAIYLGLSKHGGSKTRNYHEGSSQFMLHSETQVRVINMLATHAIYYISPDYKRAVASALKASIGTGYYNDVLISRLQSSFKIYANKSPLFYQANRFNAPHDLESVTRVDIPI